jgi:DNA-binding transcriptional regulator YiaG
MEHALEGNMKPTELKSIRSNLKLSQRELGLKIGLTGDNIARTIRRWETGETEISGPAAILLRQMATAK